MNYLTNKASIEGQFQELQFLEKEIKRSTQIFKCSEFNYPTFSCVDFEIEQID